VDVLDVQKTWFVGVDTHKQQHTAVAIDAFHQPQLAVTVSTRPGHFPALLDQIAARAPEDVVVVFGLEDTQGLGYSLAQYLVDQGFTVKEVNPVYTDRERVHDPNPDKSDPRDAQAIAGILHRKWQQLPEVHCDSRIRALKHVVGTRDQLIRQRTMVKNRLHALLHQQYPGYEEFFSDPFGVTARAFFRRFPSPVHLQGYRVRRLGAFLRKQASNMGENKAQQILDQVDKMASRDEATEVLDVLIPILIDELESLDKNAARAEREIKRLLQDSPYHLRTMPGLGDILAATLEAEIGDIKHFRSADQLARYSGIAPMEDSSGSRSRRKHRLYGRRRLNKAFYLLALGQIKRSSDGEPANAEARRYYEKKLAEGKTRKHALRCLMRRLVDIIYAMMRDRSVYRLPGVEENIPSRQPEDRELTNTWPVIRGAIALHCSMPPAANATISLSEP
jgi:transposase